MSRPILLTRDEARDYLGGIEPGKVCRPLRYGRGVRWSREALDAQIRADAGLDNRQSGDDAYETWQRNRGEIKGNS